jgi:hypothetical protein
MRLLQGISRVLLIVLSIFLSLSALGGGVGLLTGWNAPPVEDLGDSVFQDYTVPGLSLFVVIGGGALFSAILLIRRHPLAFPVTAAAGLAIMFFEFVEILVIGSPLGYARILQVLYFGTGFLMSAICIGLWMLASTPRKT